MFRFVSSKRSTELKMEYLSKYKVKSLQKRFDALMAKYPDIKAVLPVDINVRRLLVGDFRYLAKVYCAFTIYLKGKPLAGKTQILSDFVAKGFNYNSHRSKIANFLNKPSNGFDIHNCVYCDLEDVTSFTKANNPIVRRFETEHVLDKGSCPLVALSLYNFVPSCGTCNGPALKGTKTIGNTESEITQLSPSSDEYDFDGKVKFEVRALSSAVIGQKAADNPDDYEVNLNVSESIYQKSIDLFELKQRYNTGIVKIELLEWMDKRRNNPDNIVQQFADIKKVTFAEMLEEMFGLKLRRDNHYPKEKARREVMGF